MLFFVRKQLEIPWADILRVQGAGRMGGVVLGRFFSIVFVIDKD